MKKTLPNHKYAVPYDPKQPNRIPTQEEVTEEMTRQMEALTFRNEDMLQNVAAVTEANRNNVRTFLSDRGFSEREVEQLATANAADLKVSISRYM